VIASDCGLCVRTAAAAGPRVFFLQYLTTRSFYDLLIVSSQRGPTGGPDARKKEAQHSIITAAAVLINLQY